MKSDSMLIHPPLLFIAYPYSIHNKKKNVYIFLTKLATRYSGMNYKKKYISLR
jgi:hypothetical protein